MFVGEETGKENSGETNEEQVRKEGGNDRYVWLEVAGWKKMEKEVREVTGMGSKKEVLRVRQAR